MVNTVTKQLIYRYKYNVENIGEIKGEMEKSPEEQVQD